MLLLRTPPMRLISAVAAALLVGASSAASCDPLVPQYCLLPFPNDFFRSGSPPRLAGLVNGTFPPTIEGKTLDPARSGWEQLDGFSPLAPIMTYIEGLDEAALNASGAARWWSVNSSLDAASPIVLLGPAEERVPFWAELDHSSDGGPLPGDRSHMALLIWPARRLEPRTRYIVSIDQRIAPAARRSKHAEALLRADADDADDADGADAALARDHAGGRTAAAFRRDVLGPLRRAGVRPEAQLQSWDFTVGSRAQFTGRMVAARDDARKRLDATGGPKYKVKKVTNYARPASNGHAAAGSQVGSQVGSVDAAHIARKIEGSMEVPFYLNEVVPQPSLRLVLDPSSGLPVYQRLASVKFEVLVPHSVANGTFGTAANPARALQYGHGLFGSLTEVEEGYLAEDADRFGYVMGATNWIGLSNQDAVPVALLLAGVDGDMDDFAMVPDRCTQAMVNALALMQLLAKGGLATDAALTFGGDDGHGGDGGGGDGGDDGAKAKAKAKAKAAARQPLAPANAPTTGYFGNSEGGISGHVYMALTQDVPRGLLGVSGGPYALLLPRSADFADLFPAIKARFADPVQRVLLLSLIQLLWDRSEPAGYVDAVSRDPLPGTPRSTVLMHYGLGDAQVSWLGAHLLGRSLEAGGAAMFASNVREAGEDLFGFDLVADDVEIENKSAIVGFDFGALQVPLVNKPPSKATDAHEKPRRDPRAQLMMDHFFRTGRVKNTCGGPCSGLPGGGSGSGSAERAQPPPPQEQQPSERPPTCVHEACTVTCEFNATNPRGNCCGNTTSECRHTLAFQTPRCWPVSPLGC